MLGVAVEPVGGQRHVVRHIRPVSAARVAFALALTLAAIVLVGLVALYLLALASGALRTIEDFIGDVWASGEYRINLLAIIPAYLLGVVVWCLTVSGLVALFAVLYNNLAELVGGVEVVTRER